MQILTPPPDGAFDKLIEGWLSWQRTDHPLMPNYKAIKMPSIARIVPYVTIFRSLGDGAAEYRIIGEQLRLLYAENMSGRNTAENTSVSTEQVAFHKRIVNSIMGQPQGVIVHRILPENRGGPWQFKTLSLPLSDGDGKPDRGILCGCLVAPKGTKLSTWNTGQRINLSNSYMVSVQAVDIGGGITDFTLTPHSEVNVESPLVLPAYKG